MRMTGKGRVLLAGIVVLFLTVTAIAVTDFQHYTGLHALMVRLFALWGYLMVAVAAMMTPFLTRIGSVFGKPFLSMHHSFAIAGIACITAHPVSYALLAMSPAVFVPVVTSWSDFWTNAGRLAIYLAWIGAAAAVLRAGIRHSWRIVHGLMYVVLGLGVVHATLLGTDFQNAVVVGVYLALFAGVAAVFVANRLRRRDFFHRF